MLVCPRCQFENPDSNKFCQECGISLTQKTCADCGAIVSLAVKQCQSCGAATGTTWWAVISGSADAGATAKSSDGKAIFLDAERRYQILDPLPLLNATTIGVQVLDCYPFQGSPLEALESVPPEDSALSGELSPQSDTQVTASNSLTAKTQVYWNLRSQINQMVPKLHNAWRQGDQEILLLEDRSSLLPLVDYLRTQSALPMLQIWHWLYETVEIWDALDPWHCRQSLLEVQNLRVDEDQVLCLQRLYEDPAIAPTLQDFGAVWQFLLEQLSQTQSAALHLLLADLQIGKIITTTDLRSRLDAIAHEAQVIAAPSDTMPDSELPIDLTQPTAPLSNSEEETDTAPFDSDFCAADDLTLPPEEPDGDDMPTIVLPMQLFSLEDAGRTDIGRQREHNEDCFGIDIETTKVQLASGKTVRARGLYVLCDGMGGHAGGEVASQLAVDSLRRYFQQYWQNNPSAGLPAAETVREAVQLANKAIYEENQKNARSGSGRMGTTLVMVLLHDTEVAIAHVGDSRLYRYTRKRRLEQLTIDHEVGQREIQRGVDEDVAYGRPDAYQLTQALGPRDEHFVNPDIQFLELNEDAVLILASDGLTDNGLLETHWQTHIEPLVSSQTNLEEGVCQLIELANQHNGHDNITAIVIRAKVRPNLGHLR